MANTLTRHHRKFVTNLICSPIRQRIFWILLIPDCPDLKMSGLTENKLNDKLQENIKYHRKVASQTKNDLEKYKKDIKNIKVFLKSVESRSALELNF